MSQSPGVTNLAYDDDGLLYAPVIRELVRPALEPDQVLGYETLTAVGLLRPALGAFGKAVWARHGSEHLRVLIELRGHRAGMPEDELAYCLDDDDIEPVLDEIERLGLLSRSPGPARDAEVLVRLTAEGERLMDEHLSRTADEQEALFKGLAPDRLAVLRHVCLRIVSNAEARFRRRMREDGTVVPGLADDVDRLEYEGDLLYRPDVRAFIGPLEPGRVLTYETEVALRAASIRLRDVPPRRGDFAAMRRDESLRELTDRLTCALDGVAAKQLPAVRDACWRIALNLVNAVPSLAGRP